MEPSSKRVPATSTSSESRSLAARLLAPISRSFGAQITAVVTVVALAVLGVAALTVGAVAERVAVRDTDRRFDDVEAAVPAFFQARQARLEEMVAGESTSIWQQTREVAGQRPDFAWQHIEELQSGRRMLGNSVGVLWQQDVLAWVDSSGHAVWNLAHEQQPAGEDWSRFESVRRALDATAPSFAIFADGEPEAPPVVAASTAGALAFVGIYPYASILRPLPDELAKAPRGLMIVGQTIPLSELDAFAATGTRVVVHAGSRAVAGFAVDGSALARGLEGMAPSGEVDLEHVPFHFRRFRVPLAGGGGVEVVLLRSLEQERHLVAVIRAWLVGLFLLAVPLGAVLGRWFSRGMRESVQRLVDGTEAIRVGRFGHRVKVRSKDELDILASSLNRMADQLQKGAFIEERMKLFVPRAYFDYIVEHQEEIRRGESGLRRTISCLFCDLGGFTGFAEGRDPEQVLRWLNDYFNVCAGVVDTYEGSVDKFIGDGLMAIWNAPISIDAHPAKALIAALELVKASDFIVANWPLAGQVRCRVGVHTGEAVTGQVGAEGRRSNYSAIGDTVNLASRLEGANKVYGTRVLTSQTTRDLAGSAVITRYVDRIRVLGRAQPVEVHEVLGERDSPVLPRAPEKLYRAAWDLYAARRFADAAAAFDALVLEHHEDGAAATLATRAHRFATNPPAKFDGVFDLDVK
jgi:class 3 adenylate cyclase